MIRNLPSGPEPSLSPPDSYFGRDYEDEECIAVFDGMEFPCTVRRDGDGDLESFEFDTSNAVWAKPDDGECPWYWMVGNMPGAWSWDMKRNVLALLSSLSVEPKPGNAVEKPFADAYLALFADDGVLEDVAREAWRAA